MKSLVSAFVALALFSGCSNTTKLTDGAATPTASATGATTVGDAGTVKDSAPPKPPGVPFKCVPAAAAGESA